MPQDRPTAAELIEAVSEFLADDGASADSEQATFHRRVARNALAIAVRDLRDGPSLDTAERDRLVALLGHDRDLATLNAELARRIRDRDPGLDRGHLLAHLRATARDKLALANPRYPSLQARSNKKKD